MTPEEQEVFQLIADTMKDLEEHPRPLLTEEERAEARKQMKRFKEFRTKKY